MRFYTLFSGIGAPELANRQYDIGWECVGACEIDKYARAVYRFNFNQRWEIDHDAKQLVPRKMPDFNCLVFGWPCQSNSVAGKREGQKEGTRSGLLYEAIKILWDKKPDYFIAENVEGLFSVNKGYDFYATIKMFADVGYDCQWQVLNTRWFLPQNRERIYFAGHTRKKPRPKIFPITKSDFNIDESGKRTMIPRVDNTAPSIQCGISHSKRGFENSGDMSPCIRASQGQHGKLPVIIHTNKSGTRTPRNNTAALRSGASHNYQLVNNVRRLTPVEVSRLQGFPDDWTVKGIDDNNNEITISDTQRYKMAGNAMSIPVVGMVMQRLKHAHERMTK